MSLAFLPLHVWDREFDSRLILALTLMSEGKNVILGHEHNMRPMFGKSDNQFLFRSGFACNGDRSKWDLDINQTDGCVILHDEEGVNNMHLEINRVHNSNYLRLPDNGSGWGLTGAFENDAPEDTIKSCRQVAWSRLHKEFMIKSLKHKEAKAAAENTILECSSIRFDMLGEFGRLLNTKKISATKQLFGNYVLVLDNFSAETVRNSQGEPTLADGLRYLGYTEECIKKEISKHLSDLKSEKDSREMFANIITDLASKNPSTIFIMRPHPVMDPKYWKIKMAHLSNIVVIGGGNVQPWIYGASMTIHSGCTTGLEAIAADTPSVDVSKLIPSRIPMIAQALVSYGNKRVATFDELNDFVKTSINRPAQRETNFTKNDISCNDKKNSSRIRALFSLNSSIVQKKIIDGLDIANVEDIYGGDSAMSKIIDMNEEMTACHSSNEFEIFKYAKNYMPLKKSRHVTLKEVFSKTSECIRVFKELGINLPKFKVHKVSTNLFLFRGY